MRMTKIMWKRFKAPFAMAAGIVVGAALASSIAYAAIAHQPKSAPAPKLEAKPEEKKEPEKKKVLSVLEELASLRIVGVTHEVGTPNYNYSFVSADQSQTTSSYELQRAGVGVKYYSDCKAMLQYENRETLVYCL